MVEEVNRATVRYSLFAFTAGLSAFLLFVIQPMAGKHVLPWFGGSSAVWATSLCFFSALLFVGYLYVYLLTKTGMGAQLRIHAVVIGLAVLLPVVALLRWHSLFPPLGWTAGRGDPAADLLRILLQALGAPLFLLSTTGPLLQYWYAARADRDPYQLYAFSNAGSFLALVSYPILIEPMARLHVQENLWALLYFAFAVVSAGICFSTRRVRPLAAAREDDRGAPAVRLRLAWLACASPPVFLLVATTTQITQVVAPVPLLWIVPLLAYLLSLVFAFAGRGQSIHVPPLLLLLAGGVYLASQADSSHVVPRLVSYVALLFVCGLACHARLYALRPAAEASPLFYVFVSLGGLLGTLGAGILSPLLFDGFWEFPLAVSLAALFAGVTMSEQFFPRILDHKGILGARVLFGFALAVLLARLAVTDEGTILEGRNFYGVSRVEVYGESTWFWHGRTLHGAQLRGTELRRLPTTYYVQSAGVGRALRHEQELRKADDIRVGIVGLGSGTLASYCRPADVYVFYEIDPLVEKIARTHFDYLGQCPGSSVRVGDARVLLEEERRSGNLGNYDLLVVDAFNDGTVPTHLLTAEAIGLYASHLRSERSIIAVHVSNGYLDLTPVIFKIAAATGFQAVVITDDAPGNSAASESEWVLLSRDAAAFGAHVFAQSHKRTPGTEGVPLWTDDYASLTGVLDLTKLIP
jgi:hypothetical protein